ncbi:MAG: hypothetical protein ABW046_07105 [Actinoplanes sp.]
MNDFNWGRRTKLVVTAAEIQGSIKAYNTRRAAERTAQHNQHTVACSLEEFVAQLLPLEARGLTRKQIGLELGLTEGAVAGRILRARRNGLLGPRRKPDPKPLTPAQVTRLQDHRAFVEGWRERLQVAA